MTVSKIASKIYQEAKAAAKGVWNWRLEWSKAMKQACRKVMQKAKVTTHTIENDDCMEVRSSLKDDGTVEVEIDTDSYNTRANSRPWIAVVTDGIYEWGQWVGQDGQRGALKITAQPGDIIREGQKNTRKNRSWTQTYTVQADGSLVQQ